MSKDYWLEGRSPYRVRYRWSGVFALIPFLTLLSLNLIKTTPSSHERILEIKRLKIDPLIIKPEEENLETHEVVIKKGDSLYTLLKPLGVDPALFPSIIKSSKPIYNLKNLIPGRTIRVTLKDKSLERIEYPIDDLTLMILEREGEGSFVAFKEELPIQKRLVLVKGEIRQSLYEDMTKLGIDPEIVMGLADIFAWEIDFSTDIRRGDTFRVLFEEGLVDGKVVKTGPIVAATIVNQGKRYTAFAFEAGGKRGYYDIEGRSLRKRFLKSPLHYRRITSYFTRRRYHPILKTYRPHHGVDYAAPAGTPVVATGDGRVVYAGWKGGYGKFVLIKHNGTYSTAYGHMSRIAKGIRRGRYVRQGQVIGYVGSTGLSTGPHLHYEFRVRGRPVNPLTYRFPPARPVPSRYRKDFEERKKALLALLMREEGVKVAVLEDRIGSF